MIDLEIPEIFAGQRVCVLVPDATRPLSYVRWVDPLLRELARQRAHVQLLVALGLHRPMTEDELMDLALIASNYGAELWQHDARGSHVVALDDSSAPDPDGIPATFHRLVTLADHLICVGVVEPHQYAGFSGGIKTAVIGAGGEATISAIHGMRYLRDERMRIGVVDGNPFQDALWRLGARLPQAWALQVVPACGDDAPSEPAHFFGPARDAYSQAVAVARERFFERHTRAVDWLRLPVPPAKAVNFYQASRAATYVALARAPVVRPGGLVIVEADCPEGIGQGPGERACAEAMLRGRDALLAELRSDRDIAVRGGEQRAYVLARALEHCQIALVGAAPPMPELEAMGIAQFDDVHAALAALKPGDDGSRIPNVFERVPYL